jgi:sugar phosphate isomerase/epimerase
VSYQLSDWLSPLPADALLGRAHLGDGSIDFGPITRQVLAAAYAGYAEVEIFNQQAWDAPADDTALTVKARFAAQLSRAPRSSPRRAPDGPAFGPGLRHGS